ncbi:MAG TPA: hypothetical protein VEU32_07360 [Burkholderiales bacterium]|nr:hypothetical protein [Burkholderiales bacterium]
MTKIATLLAASLFLLASPAWASLEISLAPAPANPAQPKMGDNLKFESVIANTDAASARGLVAWISLIQVDPGHEQPVDLEDWSAHKALAQGELAPGAKLSVEWPMRLIQAGDYRVVISAVQRGASRPVTSPLVDFHVERKAVVESQRILPVAFGMPALLAALALLRRRRRLRVR